MLPVLAASNDRKVASCVTKNGKQAAFSNTMGLANGIDYSCVGATEYCELICYAGKLENLFKGVGAAMLHNYNALKDANLIDTFDMLNALIWEFDTKSEKKGSERIYRIHWDGDFFSETYIEAWINIIILYPHIQFWVYTRNANAAVRLHKANLPNLSLYFSGDPNNKPVADMLYRTYGIKVAFVAETFAESQAAVKDITGRPGAICPEQRKQIPLISTEGSACSVCRLCVDNKANISFSRSKK
jgi:hypothetical protein